MSDTATREQVAEAEADVRGVIYCTAKGEVLSVERPQHKELAIVITRQRAGFPDMGAKL